MWRTFNLRPPSSVIVKYSTRGSTQYHTRTVRGVRPLRSIDGFAPASSAEDW